MLSSDAGLSGGSPLGTHISMNVSICIWTTGGWCPMRLVARRRSSHQSINQLHQLFSSLLITYDLGEHLKHWETHKTSMTEDILQNIQRQTSAEIVTFNDAIYNKSLVKLDNWVQAIGGEGNVTFDWHQTDQTSHNFASEYMWGICYYTEKMTVHRADNEQKLMEEQLDFYNMVITSIEVKRGDLFFHDAQGGTSNLLLSKWNVLLCTAHSSKTRENSQERGSIKDIIDHFGRHMDSFETPDST